MLILKNEYSLEHVLQYVLQPGIYTLKKYRSRCYRWGAPNRPGARLARKRPLQTALRTPFGRTGGARAMAAATLAVSSVASARGTKRAAWLAPSSGLEAALPLGPSSQGAVLLGFFPTCC